MARCRGVFALWAVVLLGACDAREVTLPHDARAETRARLDKITASCDLPPETLTLVGDEDVAVAVRPDADYRKVDCMLEAVNRTRPKLRLGFVGNEAYDTGNRR